MFLALENENPIILESLTYKFVLMNGTNSIIACFSPMLVRYGGVLQVGGGVLLQGLCFGGCDFEDAF